MPIRLCPCGEPAVYRGKCQDCARTKERTTSRAGRAIYRSKRWQVTRNTVLSEHPFCPCGRIAEHVHHIKDIADGGLPWDLSNLQALCASCHSKITRSNQ